MYRYILYTCKLESNLAEHLLLIKNGLKLARGPPSFWDLINQVSECRGHQISEIAKPPT